MGTGAPAAGNGGVRWRAASGRRLITPRRVAFVVLLAALLFAARSCQQAQVRVPQDRAIAIARAKVDFTPTQTQVRLVRQGLSSHPYWAVSMAVPRPAGEREGAFSTNGDYRRLAVVRIDANSGKVVAVTYPNRPPGD